MKTRIFLVYGACLLLAVTLFPVRAWALPFSSATIYSTGVNPWKVVTGDWNRDGKLDAATSNAGDDTISVFLNDGLGNLTNNLNDSTCSRPYGMAAADFDSDGWTDLAVSCDGANKVSVFLNRADGTGNFFHGTESAAGNEPRGLVAYDFDGDGSMDLAMADFVGGVDVALGKGDGTFAASTPYASGLYSTDVTVGDFDNDNNVDLVVTNSCAGCFVPYGTGSVSFLSGNGDGTFNATVNTPTTRGSVSVTSDDFDGDGNRDLAIVKPRHNLMSIFTGNGDGTFNATPDLATDAGPQAITSGDVNQDGKTDILVSNSTANKFSVYTGNGNGWFNSPSTTTAGTTPLGLALGDFNRDGKLDLALANEADNTLAVYFDASPPAITALTPNSTSVGGNGIAVTITGTGFAPNSKGRVNGSDRPTTYVSPTSLSVNIGQSDVERNGTLNFTVYNPALSLTSNSSTFTVTGSSNGGGGLPPEAFLPPAQPEGGFKILLDGGAAQTGSRQVQVTFVTDAGMRVPAAKSFAISNVADFSGASILPLPSSALNWDLCAQAGGAIVPSLRDRRTYGVRKILQRLGPGLARGQRQNPVR